MVLRRRIASDIEPREPEILGGRQSETEPGRHANCDGTITRLLRVHYNHQPRPHHPATRADSMNIPIIMSIPEISRENLLPAGEQSERRAPHGSAPHSARSRPANRDQNRIPDAAHARDLLEGRRTHKHTHTHTQHCSPSRLKRTFPGDTVHYL